MPETYKQRPALIIAERLPIGGGNLSPQVVEFLDSGEWSENPDGSITLHHPFVGDIIAQRGDWIIDYGAGVLEKLDDFNFTLTFERETGAL